MTGLTEQHLDCLRHAADGLTYAEIGTRVYASPTTVRERLRDARQVLRAPNTTAAVATALRKGLIR